MTRLTPEDEKTLREHLGDDASKDANMPMAWTKTTFRLLLTEIDALRAERDLLSRGLDIETAEIESLHEEIEMLRADDDPSFVRHAEHLAALKTVEQLRAEIATFRNASPSLCNCSQCMDLREELTT